MRDLGFMLYDIDHAKRPRLAVFPRNAGQGRDARPATQFAGDSPMSALASLVRAYERLRRKRCALRLLG